MTLTASEVSSLADTLTKWEYAEYVFTALVVVACLGEYLADFTRVWARGGLWACLGPMEDRKDRLAKLSTLVLIAALALELVCLVRTNHLSGLVIGSLDERSNEAMVRSVKALDDSTSAVTQSGIAQSTSAKAVSQSDTAVVQSGKALKEADSFEEDIKVAKQQAANAESHLAEAVSMAKAEEAQLGKLAKEVEPRILTVEQQRSLIVELRKFSGRTVDVISYGLDGEGAALATQIISVLSLAGINVRDDRASTVVSGGFDFGVHVRGPEIEQPFVLEMGRLFSEKGNLQVFLNTQSAPRAAIVGRAAIGGSAALGGGSGPTTVGPSPTGSPVIVQVGIKPVQVVLAR
jgi:hypothetical protein